MDADKTEANGGPANVLREARDLISDPERWTRRATARDTKGNPAHPCSESAVRWCAFGAVRRVSPDRAVRNRARVALEEALGSLWEEEPHWELVEMFNDTRPHAEVLALFDRAIELAEQAGD